MQTPATQDEFPDLKTHQQMWSSFTGALTRGVIAVLVVVLFTAWVTGVI
jgi:hypothetical protein